MFNILSPAITVEGKDETEDSHNDQSNSHIQGMLSKKHL